MSDLRKYPKFSVLMSVYKKEKPEYLDFALKSIEHQTVKPHEIILVEDGPITHSLQKIVMKHKRLFGNNFKVIVSTTNKGLGNALRLGTNYVTTNWIARMDSDDYSVPNRFQKQLEFIINNPDVAVVGGQIVEFSESINNPVGERRVPLTKKNIYNFMKWRSPFNHPTVFINKQKLDCVGGYIPFGNLEDYYLWVRIILQKFDVRNINMPVVYMRVDEGMYSRRGKASNIKYIYQLRKYLRLKKSINYKQEITGNIIMTLNIIIPEWIRKFLYRRILHK